MPYFLDDNDIPILEFGKGDIMVLTGIVPKDSSWKFLIFQDARKSYPIGIVDEINFPSGTDECDTCMQTVVKFAFNKVESIDVIIDALNEIKLEMLITEEIDKSIIEELKNE